MSKLTPLLLLCLTTPLFAAEGMWMPQQVPQLSAELQKLGIKIDPNSFADLTGQPMGAVVSLGKPDESALVAAINYADLEMPPDGKLSDAEIAALTEWVKIGAPWPEDADSGTGPTIRARRDKITDEDKKYVEHDPIIRAGGEGGSGLSLYTISGGVRRG